MHLMVADTHAHANAIIHWMKLPAAEWCVAAYGDEITQAFDSARLVRPSEGCTQGHIDWILANLMPNTADPDVVTVPPYWTPADLYEQMNGESRLVG